MALDGPGLDITSSLWSYIVITIMPVDALAW